MDDDFADELDRLKLVIKKKNAELDEARAQQEVAIERRRTQRPTQPAASREWSRRKMSPRRKPSFASPRPTFASRQVELEEPELQHRNVERWRARIRQILDAMQKPGDAGAPNASGARR